MNRARTNFFVDVGTGIAGLVSAVSGLVFLLPGDPTAGILGVSYQAWNSLHTWSSLAAIAGVAAHTVLHWRWMVSMTKQMFSPSKQRPASDAVPQAACGDAASAGLSRRTFLAFGGAATVVAATVLAGYKALVASSAAGVSLSEDQQAAAGQESGVACPFGVTNDPYPGRCHFYVDSDGDGMCDYSVAGSGGNLASGSSAEAFPGGSHRRLGFGRP